MPELLVSVRLSELAPVPGIRLAVTAFEKKPKTCVWAMPFESVLFAVNTFA